MQTFLPYPSFQQSVECLDYRRLGKQRVECVQLIRAIENGGGWSNHPAAVMWRGYTDALRVYHDWCLHEWEDRGYKNNMPYLTTAESEKEAVNPPWLGDSAFHAAHRSALLWKDPEWYGKFGWTEKPENPKTVYIWPTKNYPTDKHAVVSEE